MTFNATQVFFMRSYILDINPYWVLDVHSSRCKCCLHLGHTAFFKRPDPDRKWTDARFLYISDCPEIRWVGLRGVLAQCLAKSRIAIFY